jgi:hypothetical protein
MTNRENQQRLDRIALLYLTAIEVGDFDQIDSIWKQAESDTELAEMLHELNAESVKADEAIENDKTTEQITATIAQHLPSAEVIRPATDPVTVAQVAEYIRKNPPAGLTGDDLRLNDQLRATTDTLPQELGVPQVLAWGRRFGNAPEAYWKAFRSVALKLRMQQESASNYQMAARPKKRKPSEDKP